MTTSKFDLLDFPSHILHVFNDLHRPYLRLGSHEDQGERDLQLKKYAAR